MATIEDVGTVIHVLRVIQTLSQGELASMSGVRNSSISNYERRKAVPKLETLQKLAQGMGLPLSAVQDTQDFIHRIRSQVHTGGDRLEAEELRLWRDGTAPDPEVLCAEMERLAGDAGRVVSRLLRTLFRVLAAEALGHPPS